MNIQVIATWGMVFFSLLPIAFASSNHVECVARLEELVPEAISTHGLAVLATWHSTSETYAPTDEMYRKQLLEEYNSSIDNQKRFNSADEYVEALLAANIRDDEAIRNMPTRHWVTRLIVSESNIIVRNYSALDQSSPTQEIVMVKMDRYRWHTYSIDHLNKSITERIDKNANEFYSLYLSLTPQESFRNSWEFNSKILNRETPHASLAKLLCDSGKVQINDIVITYEYLGGQEHTYEMRISVPTGNLQTKMKLRKEGGFTRLLKMEVLGPELTSQMSYEYQEATSPWPSHIRLVERNIQSGQTLLNRDMRILEVARADQWDYESILNALLSKHVDYSFIDLVNEDVDGELQPRMSITKSKREPTFNLQTSTSTSSSVVGIQDAQTGSKLKMVCPGCHGDDKQMTNCALCGGRGTVWINKPHEYIEGTR